jgi:hypothetical protein
MKSMKEVLGEKGTIKIVGADAFTQEGFTQIPNAILRSKEIGGMEKCTYSLLLSYAWHNDSCFPGQDRLAQDLGCHRSTANGYIRNLRKKGFINVKRQGLNKPNIYEVNLKAKVLKTGKR